MRTAILNVFTVLAVIGLIYFVLVLLTSFGT